MPAVSDSLHLTGPQPAPQAAADSVATDSMVFNTVIVDSIGADTVHGRIPHFIPVDKADSLRVEAYADSLEAYSALPEVPQGSREGVAPLRRGTSLTHDSGLTLLMAAMLIMTGINTPSVVKALKSYRHELWSVRRRPNVFDDERTVSHRAATLLALVFIVFGGSALYFLPGLPPSPSFWGAAASMTLTGLYYLFQYTAYSLVGYAFASPDGRRQWLSGFNATQAYSGICLIVPALLLIFRPEWYTTLIWLSAAIYLVGRALFIVKGFRIFFINFRSLLYFILYLCTLEIIPLLGVCAVNEYLRTYNL
jgi:hypothetical protein